jgi:hypothetical protein
MFRRHKRNDRGEAATAACGQQEADAMLARAEQDVEEQRVKLAADMPLRKQLQEIRAKNHLAEQLLAALSERREGRPNGAH